MRSVDLTPGSQQFCRDLWVGNLILLQRQKLLFFLGLGFDQCWFFFWGGGVGGAGGLLLYPNTVKLKLSESTTLGIYEGSRN